jgi:hypothetical protein
MLDAAYEYVAQTGDRSVWASMRAIIDREWSAAYSSTHTTANFEYPEMHPMLISGKKYEIPIRLVTEVKQIYMQKIRDILPADVDIIVETGSGWSRNIHHFVTSAILTRFRNVRLYALEFSIGGRSVCRFLHWLGKDTIPWKVFCGRFNYYKPDYSFVLDNEKRAFLKAGQKRPSSAFVYR